MKHSIAIYAYNSGLLGLKNDWRFSMTMTWDDYVEMAKNHPGEGVTWQAVAI